MHQQLLHLTMTTNNNTKGKNPLSSKNSKSKLLHKKNAISNLHNKKLGSGLKPKPMKPNNHDDDKKNDNNDNNEDNNEDNNKNNIHADDIVPTKKDEESKITLASAGCLTCRQRHKKCTRETPVCATCKKTGYICFWREPGTKFTDYKVKLVHTRHPRGKILKPNLLINPEDNIESADYHLSDDGADADADSADDKVDNSFVELLDNDGNIISNEEPLISVAKKAVFITNAYMNSPEMQTLLKKEQSKNDGSD